MGVITGRSLVAAQRYYYDSSERLSRMTEAGASGELTLDYRWTYDHNDNVAKLVETVGDETFTYTFTYNNDQIATGVSYGDTTEEILFDGYGRTSSTIIKNGVPAVANAYHEYREQQRSTVAEKADERVRATVKRSSQVRYWSATIRSNHVDIGRPLIFSMAVYQVQSENDVFAVTGIEARGIAIAAGGGHPWSKNVHSEIDRGMENTPGYYRYHRYNRDGGHVFYLFP